MSARTRGRWGLTVLPLLALGLLAGGGAFAGEPTRVPLEGAPAAVTPPEGEWTRRTATPLAGQWMLFFSAPDGTAVCEARVFPVKELRDPATVLPQAIDLVVRATGGDAFGMGTIETAASGGRPTAQTAVTAVFGGTPWRGSARLLLATDDVWAFAWGLAADDAPPARRRATEAFPLGLVATGPSFHEPKFRFEGLDVRVVEVPDEEPVTQRDLLAADLLVEVAREYRFPLAIRAKLRDDLAVAARDGARSAELRERLRIAGEAVAEAEQLTDDMRRNSYRLHGASLVPYFAGKVKLPAVQSDDQRIARAGESLLEWSAFLASIALDAPVPTGPWEDVRNPDSFAKAEASAAMGAEWAAARRAWDEADADRRFRFRKAVLVALAQSPEEAARIEALGGTGDLRAWLDRRTPPDAGALRKAAAALPSADRKKLLDVLGAGDGSVRFGW